MQIEGAMRDAQTPVQAGLVINEGFRELTADEVDTVAGGPGPVLIVIGISAFAGGFAWGYEQGYKEGEDRAERDNRGN